MVESKLFVDIVNDAAPTRPVQAKHTPAKRVEDSIQDSWAYPAFGGIACNRNTP